MSLHKQIATLTLEPHWWKLVFPKTLPRICPLGSDCKIRALIWIHSSKMKMKRSVSHFWILDLLSSPFHREYFVPGTLISKLEKNLNRGLFRTLILKIFPGSFIFKISDSYHHIGACMSALLFIVLHWPGSRAVASEVQRSSDWRKEYLLSNKDQIFVCYLSCRCSGSWYPQNWADHHTNKTAQNKNNYLFLSFVECWIFGASLWRLNINSRCC